MVQPAPLPLLNVYEVENGGERRFLIAFLDTILAGAKGIDDRSVVGDYTPAPDGGFQPETFRLNPGFVETFTHYMNDRTIGFPSLIEEAKKQSGSWLYVVDPRYHAPEDEETPAHELIGAFAVDETGQIVPASFLYNEKHRWFADGSGVSGVLNDRDFYQWLHDIPAPAG